MNVKELMPEFPAAAEWLNRKVTNSDLIGSKPTLIHFWSVSCELCKQAMPFINELRSRYADQLNVIAVHMPRSEADLNREKIKQTAAEHQMGQPILLDNEHQVTKVFENRYVPAYYLFDAKGQHFHFQAGSRGLKELEGRITRLLTKTGKAAL